MAKVIRMTPEYIDELKRDFEQTLRTAKLSDGKLSFTRSVGAVKRSAVVYYTRSAWAKQQALISGYDKEVAWHGVAKRGSDPEKDEYVISDIMVYPQEVTDANVTTDQAAYQTWLMDHDDEVFNNIRYQGHSHVNMGTTPSGVDDSWYERILDQLEDDMFYIFMVWNKRGEKTIRIYDLAKNVLFETADVTVTVIETPDDADLRSRELTDEERKALSDFLISFREKKKTDAFLAASKEMVKDKVYKPQYTTPNEYNKYGGWYGKDYYGKDYYGSSYHGNPGTAAVPAKEEPKPKTADTEPQEASGGKKKGKRMGRRVKRSVCAVKPFHTAFDDDDDDPDDMYDWPGKPGK